MQSAEIRRHAHPLLTAAAVAGLIATAPLDLLAQTPASTPDSAKVTEAINVVVHKPRTGEERPAKVNEQIQGDEVLRTGERSLAEVEFKDKTVTRLGSKSVFTFDGQPRKYKVQKGLAVICVPKGAGEEKGRKKGEISSSSLTAAIEGTTVLVQELDLPPEKPGGPPRHASRMIFVEGNGTVTTPDGKKSRKVKAGQMMVRFEDELELPAPVDVDLAALLQGSAMMSGFSRNLPSADLIGEAIQQQQIEIATGALDPVGGNPGASGSPPDSASQNAGRGTSVLPCENVGNGFFLGYHPCPGCTVIEPLPEGGYVCRQN